ARLAGITLQQVPYRGGGQAINDLIAGHVQLGSLGTTPLVPHYKAGTLKLLAQSMATRSPALADVPTYQEAGMNGLVVDQRLGVFVPNGASHDIITRLNKAVGLALQDEAVRKAFLEQAQEPAGGSSDQYARLVRDDSEKYARLVAEVGVKAQ